MTWTQWLFEYHALAEKEEGDARMEAELLSAGLKRMRDILVATLGLNLVPPDPAKPLAADAPTPFVPFSFLVGQPEVMQEYLTRYKRAEAENASVDDEAFETFSSELLEQLKTGKSRLPEGMVPLLTKDLAGLRGGGFSLEDAEILRSLGVKPAVDQGPVPHITARPKVFATAAPATSPFASSSRAPDDEPIDETELARFKAALKGSD